MGTRGGSIKSTSINGVKLYSLSSQRSTPSWLTEKKKRALRKDKDYLQRVELIQDLKFDTATNRIKVTPDGDYVIASGTYPPQVKVYELKELSLKFERHLISEIVNFQILGDDYSKIAFMCADRSVCLHAKYGSHYTLRIPRMGRDIAYDCWSCDLLCAASSPDLYRINLEQGRFLQSLTSQSPALNVVSRSSFHGLIACGGEDGAVECFDTRRKSSVGRINTSISPDEEVTALQFDESQGYQIAVGSSTGKISIYDLRMSNPIRVKDHMYGSPILSIKWHQTLNSTEPKLITADSHIVRIWDPNTGDNMTSIEPNGGTINDVCIFKNSGLMLLALDNGQIPSYFVPALGPALKWCSYLENLTEELEEHPETTIYDDYKFLTREEIERLNLTNLIGTNLLRAYMHGFFVDYRLYKKAQALANPFAYDAYIEKKKQEKIQAERASRITIARKLPKVNRDFAAELHEREERENNEGENNNGDDTSNKKRKKNKGLVKEILTDDRFKSIFENLDYEIDEQSKEYLQYHPQQSANKIKRQASLIEEHFDPVPAAEEYQSDGGATDSDSSDNENLEPKKSKPRFYEIKDERHADAFVNKKSLGREDALPLGERVAALQEREKRSDRTDKFGGVRFGPGGSREISFFSKSGRKNRGGEEGGLKGDIKKRGVGSLGLKPSKQEFYAISRNKGGPGRSRGKGRR